MDSFEDIVSRVLRPAAEKITQGLQGSQVQPAARRPLRDPYSDTASFFQDISSAVQSIRSPEVATALQSRVGVSDDRADGRSRFADSGDDDSNTFTSPAESRKTTISDDSRVAGELSNAATAMIRQVVGAGNAIADFSRNTGKLDDAFEGMTDTTKDASKSVPAMFAAWFGKNVPSAAEKHWFGPELLPSPAGKGEQSSADKVSSFLNSSSLADGLRGLIGRQDAAGSGTGGSSGSLKDRANDAIDGMLHKSMSVFRSMSSPNQSSVSRSIGRAGRRLLAGNFKARVQRGGQMARGMSGRAIGSPSSPAVRSMFGPMGSPGSIPGMAGGAGGSAGGGLINAVGGAVGGGGAGGAAAGGAGAAGGAAAAGGAGLGAATIATGGLILAFVALIAVVTTAAKTLYNLGMQGYETSLRLAHLDGPLAGAKAQLEVNRLMRDIQSAHALSDSGSRLIKTFDRLEAALRPITDGSLVVGMEFLIVTINLVIATFNGLVDTLVMTTKLAAMATVNPFDNIAAQMFEDKIKDMRNPQAPVNVNPLAFFDELKDRPIRPPRPPLPPLVGPVGRDQ